MVVDLYLMHYVQYHIRRPEGITNTVSFLTYVTRAGLVLEVTRLLSFLLILMLGAYLDAYTLSYIEYDDTVINLVPEKSPRVPNRVDASIDVLPTTDNKPTCKTNTNYYLICGVLSIASAGLFLMN